MVEPPATPRELLVALSSHQEMEQALLGALLCNNSVAEREEVARLSGEHFGSEAHGRIFDTAVATIRRGQAADPQTLAPFFEGDPAFKEPGGVRAYLLMLMSVSASIINAEHYASAIRDLAVRRRLVRAGLDLIEEAGTPDPTRPLDDVIATSEGIIARAVDDALTTDNLEHISQASERAIARADAAMKAAHTGKAIGVTTGLASLDRETGGLHKSDLLVLAARPAMGKTAKAGTTCLAAARAGVPVLFFSLEMSSEQIADRFHAAISGISVERIRTGRLHDSDLPNLMDARAELAALPIYIDDTPAISVAHMRARARRVQRRAGLGLIIVDYLQLMRGDARNRDGNRVQEVSEISRGLKGLAKEFDVPVLALSQLSRAVEQREDKRPQLADLRESGSIEQDADAVIFLYRHEYYIALNEPRQTGKQSREQHAKDMDEWSQLMEAEKGKAELLIRKQRHGGQKTIMVAFDGERGRFSDLVLR